MRQFAQPFAKERFDLLRGESLADPLRGRKIGAGEQPVIRRFKSDAFLPQLALEILMAVETELGRVGKVGAKLDEKRAKVLVHAVEVIEIDHGRGVIDPG